MELMADIEVLMHKFDVLRATMKDHMQEMIYERGVGGSEYHTNKVLKAIEEYIKRMKSLVASAASSNDTLVSDSEEENSVSCLRLKYEEAIVLAVDEEEEDMGVHSMNCGPEIQFLVGEWRR